jgi:hypothetical protein
MPGRGRDRFDQAEARTRLSEGRPHTAARTPCAAARRSYRRCETSSGAPHAYAGTKTRFEADAWTLHRPGRGRSPEDGTPGKDEHAGDGQDGAEAHASIRIVPVRGRRVSFLRVALYGNVVVQLPLVQSDDSVPL